MYEIYFYKDKSGRAPVLEYLRELSGRNDKDSRIKAQKIGDYIEILREYGIQAGEPYIKHLTGDIWELRPIRDRILFATWNGSGFVLLHCFVKKTQKTPAREIQRAKKNLIGYRERSDSDEDK